MKLIMEMDNRKSEPTKLRSNTKSIESNLGAVPKIDIAEKPSMNLQIIWSKIRDYFGMAIKGKETKSVPIIKDDANIQKKVEEIKDRRFFIVLQREFKKVPKHSRKQMKMQFIKFIQDGQTTKDDSHEDEGYFMNLMSSIKQEVLLF